MKRGHRMPGRRRKCRPMQPLQRVRRTFLLWELPHLTGGLEAGRRHKATGKICQFRSLKMSYGVIEGRLWVVTIRQKATENAAFVANRTSDFRHLGLWP
jgi:hypothetical protein